jgi:hypothetical protein
MNNNYSGTFYNNEHAKNDEEEKTPSYENTD